MMQFTKGLITRVRFPSKSQSYPKKCINNRVNRSYHSLCCCHDVTTSNEKRVSNRTHEWTSKTYYFTTFSVPFWKRNRIIQQNSLFTSSATEATSSSNLKKRKIIAQKAPVKLTPKARKFFKGLLEVQTQKNNKDNEIIGIMLKYQQSKSGEPRMVYTFDFVTQKDLSNRDEPVSLEVTNETEDEQGDEIPKSPQDSYDDGLPKLYINQHAFMKVLGSTIDIDTMSLSPILYDKEGNVLDPNA